MARHCFCDSSHCDAAVEGPIFQKSLDNKANTTVDFDKSGSSEKRLGGKVVVGLGVMLALKWM